MTKSKPLVLDVDGTFLRTDILFECFWASLGKAPLRTLSSVFHNFSKPAALKRYLADLAERCARQPQGRDARTVLDGRVLPFPP